MLDSRVAEEHQPCMSARLRIFEDGFFVNIKPPPTEIVQAMNWLAHANIQGETMKKILYFAILLTVLFAAGCSPVQGLRRNIDRKHSFDPQKSYALNMLHAATYYNPGIYDSPDGGGALMWEKDKAPNPEKKPVDGAQRALGAGMAVADANSLSRLGVSSGAEGAVVGALLLLGSDRPQGDPMFGKSYRLFGWVPRDKDEKKEEVKERAIEAVRVAMVKATEEFDLPKGFSFTGVGVEDENSDTFFSMSPPTILAKVSGGFCDEGKYVCAYRINTGKFAGAVDKSRFPEEIGDGDAWVFAFSGGRFALPVNEENGVSPSWQHADLPKFPEAPFFKLLSKHLPTDYFFMLPPKSGFGCSPAPTETGELECLQKPVMLHQGEEHYFITPAAQTASAR